MEAKKQASKTLAEAREEFIVRAGWDGIDYALREYGDDLAALDAEFAAIRDAFCKASEAAGAYVERHAEAEEVG